MKKLILTSATATLLAATSYADIVYTAPGMETAKTAAANGNNNGTWISANEVLGKFYEYQITGVEWQLGAGVAGQGIKGNGDFKSSRGYTQPGDAHLTVSLAGHTLVEESRQFTNINQTESGSLDLSDNPIIIRAQDIHLVVTLNTNNMSGDKASYVAFKGIALKDSPVPSGDLDVSRLVRENATPNVNWVIRREGVYGTAPSFNIGNTNWTPGDGNGNGGGGETSTSSGSEAPNAGRNKTNNGHGNNIDGVDVSNPGKSAEKWAARGIIDESGSFDDEGSGGGAAPSQQ